MIVLEKVYQNDLVLLEENKINNYIQLNWLQQPNSQELRKEVKTIAEYIARHKYNKVLSDVRQRYYLNISDQNWLNQEIFPIYNQIGKFKFAYLVSPTNIEMLDIYRIQEAIQSKPESFQQLAIEVFMEINEAQAWLLE